MFSGSDGAVGSRPGSAAADGGIMNGLGILLPSRACRASDAVKLGIEAEELGYSAVWAPEVSTFDAISVVAALAGSTSRIGLGTAIVPLDSRSPAVLAMSAATLSDLAPGRVSLGLGVSTRTIIEGWHGREFGHPLAKVRDAIAIIQQALGGQSTSAEGRHFSSVGFHLDVVPHQRPRIYLATLGPAMRKLALELADGMIFNFLPRSKASVLVSQLGGSQRHVDKTAFVRVALSDAHGDSERRLRREMASYLRIEQYRNWLVSLGLEAFPSLGGEGLDLVADTLPTDFVNDVAILGDPQSCFIKLR
ncbi:MAG: LLM class flavin-dependent oxidoreductase, partial [Actinomycetota bacterium]